MKVLKKRLLTSAMIIPSLALSGMALAGGDHGSSCSSATRMNVNSSSSGRINSGGDADYFRIQVPSSGTLTIYTSGSTDTLGELINSRCNRLASNDDGGSSTNFRINRSVSSGTYYIKVRHYSSRRTGSYTLRVNFSRSSSSSSSSSGSSSGGSDDHGNSCNSATTVSTNSSRSGRIERGGDNDYFRIQVPSSGTLTLDTTGSTDTYGYLLNSSCGSSITSNDDSGSGRNFRIIRSISSGTYYVRVRHYNSSSGTGSYTLRVNFSRSSSSSSSSGSSGGTPGMTSPANGSTLSGASQTFSWSANGASVAQWWLYVGSSLGSYDIYNLPQGTSTSRTVTGLPTNGSRVYVRLWWYRSGSWANRDYTYTGASSNGTLNDLAVDQFSQKTGTITAGRTNNFYAEFRIRNTSSSRSVRLEDAALAIVSANNSNHNFDCWRNGSSSGLSLQPSGRLPISRKNCAIYNAGTFHVEVRLKLGGQWQTKYRGPSFTVQGSLVYPVAGLPGDTSCPSDVGESRRQNGLPRSWYTVVWGGKYNGNWNQRCKGSGGHPGVDIRVSSGTPVRAIGIGTVHQSYDSTSWGGLIVIRHDISGINEPVWSVYAHLKRRDVNVGDEINAGQPIGLSGGALSDPNHGNSTGPHLHFQIDKGNDFLYPYWPARNDGNSVDPNLSDNTYDPLQFIESH